MAHRYYTSDIAGGEGRITGADAAHLARVLRARAGETILLCDGNNTEYTGSIVSAAPDLVVVAVDEGRPSAAEPDIFVEAYIGYAKGERMEWAVQKCVELGVGCIQPFYSRNTVVKPGSEEKKTARLNRIATEAAKQCGRGILPRVAPPVGFAEAASLAGQNELALFLYEGGGESLRRVLSGQRRLAIITGAEGGFTPEEAALAAAAGCVTVGLGPRILRCETAPAAALAAVMALTGNLE